MREIRRRALVLDGNPLEWLTARKRLGPVLVWIILLLLFSFMMLVTGGFEVLFGARNYGEESFIYALGNCSNVQVVDRERSVYRFRIDRGENAMELLLSHH